MKGSFTATLNLRTYSLTASGKLWVADFGLAHVQSDKSLTMSGDMLGTLRYMSPEQLAGDKVVDQRTDIYSLGLTMYETLAAAARIYWPNSRAADPADATRRTRDAAKDSMLPFPLIWKRSS